MGGEMNDQLRRAVADYTFLCGQMPARKAAAHTMQTFGITAQQLADALRDELVALTAPEDATDPSNGGDLLNSYRPK